MADNIKPHVADRVKKIREWENANNFTEAKDNPQFKLYKNYYVPTQIVKRGKNVLSFGVGGHVGFEKELVYENQELDVDLYDPTPFSIRLWDRIRHISSRVKITNQSSQTRNIQVSNKLNYNAFAYNKDNGTFPFYYDPTRKLDQRASEVSKFKQSFSLIKIGNHFKSVDVKAKNLETIMQEKDYESVDIIKADIEGLWWDFAHEVLDKKIDVKFIALELELNFEKDERVEPALDKAQIVCDKFKANNYDVIINRKRGKLMLELLFVRRDSYEG